MTDTFAVPRDVWAERAFVGGLLAAQTIPDELDLDPSIVWDPHLNAVATACRDLHRRGVPCDPASVRGELLRTGQRSNVTDGAWLIDLMQEGCLTGSLTHHAKNLRTLAVRRELITVVTRAGQAASSPDSDPFDVAAELAVTTSGIADSGDPIRPPTLVDAAEFLAGPIEFDWLIPGLLEKGDRLIVTGGEGSGKSVLTRQIAVSAAAGVHPFKGERIAPSRVLFVDLENGTRHLRRELMKMWRHTELIGCQPAPGALTVESRPSGIDLTKYDDRLWLHRLCDAARPDLLVIGPLYRMHAADMNLEPPARDLTRTIDAIRARHNCAVVMETHSPHAQGGVTRSLRPVGSSLFMRWPEFGYGLRPDSNDNTFMKLGSWRGPRDERDFPRTLVRGGEQEWPWAPYNAFAPVGQGWQA